MCFNYPSDNSLNRYKNQMNFYTLRGEGSGPKGDQGPKGDRGEKGNKVPEYYEVTFPRGITTYDY